MSEAVYIAHGFSLANRLLLYAGAVLAPVHFASGVANNWPGSLGLLALNWYTQLQWYHAIQHHQLNALALLPVHYTFVCTYTYLGGIASGNIYTAVVLMLATVGAMVHNVIDAWTAWAANLTDGFGKYEFFFFGWQKLESGWRTFMAVWLVGDTMAMALSVAPP